MSKNPLAVVARTLQRDADGHPKDAKRGPVVGSAADHSQRKSARQLGEVCRAAHGPEELQAVLWSIFAGEDPFAAQRGQKRAKRQAENDGVPVVAGDADEIDWKTRMKAGDMWAQYAYGKPLSGVVVEAMIQSQNVSVNIGAGPIDPRDLPPAMRHMMRALALAALGKTPADLEVVANAPRALPGASLARRASASPPLEGSHAPGVEASPSSAVDLDDLGCFDVDAGVPAGAVGQVEAGVNNMGHDQNIGRPAEKIKNSSPIRLDFRTSTNLISAELVDGVCSVTFRVKTGIGPTFKYANVTPTMMRQWGEAESAGAWFAREIRVRHQQYPVIKSVAVVAPGGTDSASSVEAVARGGTMI